MRRLLPAVAMQSIGPFIFFDHFGPIDADPAANHDVRPHPHIGLATVTYLYEGAMMHRDSVGSVQRIEPGAINWMTAGSGIVHSERTPEDLVGKPRRSHGLQLWAALPKAHEEVPASFSHTPSAAIPEIDVAGGRARVLIGSAFGLTSPVPTFSETLYLDITLEAGAALRLDNLPAQAAVYAVEGELAVDGVALPPSTMAVLDSGKRCAPHYRARRKICRHWRCAARWQALHFLEFCFVEQGAPGAGRRTTGNSSATPPCQVKPSGSRCPSICLALTAAAHNMATGAARVHTLRPRCRHENPRQYSYSRAGVLAAGGDGGRLADDPVRDFA